MLVLLSVILCFSLLLISLTHVLVSWTGYTSPELVIVPCLSQLNIHMLSMHMQ